MDMVSLLQNSKLKATPQRLRIVEDLHLNGHMNIDDIYKSLQNSFPSISLATIYKNINMMIEISFLNEVKIPNHKSVYELAKQEHSHVVCSNCNKIMDIELDTSILLKQASNLSSYSLEKSSIVFDGLCPHCQ